MADITELRRNIDILNRSRTAAAKKKSYTEIQKSIEELESHYDSVENELKTKDTSLSKLEKENLLLKKNNDSLSGRVQEILEEKAETERKLEELSGQREAVVRDTSLDQVKKENLTLKQDCTILDSRIKEILKEKAETEKKLEQLSRTRPELSSTNLVRAFRDSLEEMDEAMNSSSSKVNYNVSSMNVRLRTNIAVKNNGLSFQLPKADDVIPPENLSEVEFTISSSAKEAVFSDYVDVPDVVGLDMDTAVSMIRNAGFEGGEVTEAESDLMQGTVLSQMPSGNAVAKSGDAVDIVISKIISVHVPDLTGKTLKSARKLLSDGRLSLGEVTEKVDTLKAGTIIEQSVEAKEYADIGAAIDVTVAIEKSDEE